MKLKTIQFIALFLLMLVTGLFWGTWFALSRSIQDFSAAEFIHIGKVIIAKVAMPMRIILPTCILLMGLSMWLYPQKRSAGFYFNVFAFILILVTLYITVGIEVPMDNQIKQWTASTVPADWEAIRGRWQFFHTTRTFISLISFGSFMASMRSYL
jgi:hypothetical protein